MACVSAGTWFRTRSQSSSISAVNGFSGRTRTSSVAVNVVSANNSQPLASGMLHCSFLSSSSPFSSGSSFSGLSWGVDLTSNNEVRQERGHRLVVRAGRKFQLAQTKRNKSRKSLARTHGFRLRMRTTSGRALLKRRRAKGRKVLCPKSNPSGGKRA